MDWTRGPTIGRGSTATVSFATSPSGVVFVAKSAELSQSEFLQREQRILSSVASPYIIGYNGHAITQENNRVMYNLFLDYMPHGSLTDAIRRGLHESLIKNYTYQILGGLCYLHSHGLAHCDIKGSNVLVGQHGTAKIADFGCAKRVEDEPSSTANFSGTPMYMAPEVARGEEQGYASDIWSLGCTLIEMATGNPPWPNAIDPVSLIYRVGFTGQVPVCPENCLSKQGRDFLDKCLTRDPKDRWTASELLEHEFVAEFRRQSKEFNSTSNSPTSILDQKVWNSVDEVESTMTVDDHTRNEVSERIGRLCSVSGWGLDESGWITVRDESNIFDDFESKDLLDD